MGVSGKQVHVVCFKTNNRQRVDNKTSLILFAYLNGNLYNICEYSVIACILQELGMSALELARLARMAANKAYMEQLRLDAVGMRQQRSVC